jgi:hypothetical protein
VRKGDALTRKLDGAIYQVVRVVPNGLYSIGDGKGGAPSITDSAATR